jgi:hypothetical protein
MQAWYWGASAQERESYVSMEDTLAAARAAIEKSKQAMLDAETALDRARQTLSEARKTMISSSHGF